MPSKIKRKIHRCTCEHCHLHPYSKTAKQHQAINRVLFELNERNKRRFAGVLANERGRGGTSQLAEITGLSRTTIARGRSEIERANQHRASGVRRSGAGRPRVEKTTRHLEGARKALEGCNGRRSNDRLEVDAKNLPQACQSVETKRVSR